MKKRTLYLECYSGISGDMTVAALLDLGADREGLLEMLEKMPLEGFHVEIGRSKKCGIDACDFDVVLEREEHAHRHLSHIYEIIEQTPVKDSVKNLAKQMFLIVAEAEAKAHGIPVEHVHFHEVGAVDSIVDIMSAAYCIESLNVQNAVVSELYEGTGQVKCQHGILPVPVPAVVNIVKQQDLSMHMTENRGEMITPTGAAIAAALQTYGNGKGKKEGKLLAIGIGAGKKDFAHANILRTMLFEEKEQPETVWMLETNIDDSTGETIGYTTEKLLEAGALDVFCVPIYMKKNRPAVMLSVLAKEEDCKKMEEIIFLNTSTIGIRRHQVMRSTLERHQEVAETSYGQVQIKVIKGNQITKRLPEYEDVKAICDRTKEGFWKVYDKIRCEVAKGEEV